MWSLFYTLICTVLQILLMFEICTPVQPPSQNFTGGGEEVQGSQNFLVLQTICQIRGCYKVLDKENIFLLYLAPEGGSYLAELTLPLFNLT